MFYLRFFMGFLLCSLSKGSAEGRLGRSLYKPSIENKTLAGTDCVTLEKKLDVLFLLDVSSSAVMKELIDFVMYTTKVLELGPKKTKVAVATAFSGFGFMVTPLNDGQDHKQFETIVRNLLPVTFRWPFNLGSAPAFLENEVFSPLVGARADAKKVVIMIAGSFPQLSNQWGKFMDLKSKNFRFFVVGISTTAKNDENLLKLLVNNPQDYVYLDNYNLLATCEVINEALTKAYGCDPCLPNPCTNGGECTPNRSSYTCQCPAGRRGTLCEHKDLCRPNPCNGGQCINPISNTIVCTCPQGHTGSRCEQVICPPGYCLNGGKCGMNKRIGHIECKCPLGYTGVHCHVLNRFCDANPTTCLNGGTCVNLPNYDFECRCTSLCYGRQCEQCTQRMHDYISTCSSRPCKGGCTCVPSSKHESGYYCRSKGSLGKNCTIATPEVNCNPTSIYIRFSRQLMDEMQEGTADGLAVLGPNYSSSSSCKFTNAAHNMLEMSTALGACASQVTASPDGKTTISNTVWFVRSGQSSSFTVTVPLFLLRCVFDKKEYHLITSLSPAFSAPRIFQNEVSMQPQVSLCMVATCPRPCPREMDVSERAIFTTGQEIHFSFSLKSSVQANSINAVSVQRLAISCAAAPSSIPGILLMQNGCAYTPADFPLKIQQSGTAATACLSIRVPRSITCFKIYIHAHLQECSSATTVVCPDRLAYTCAVPPGRKRRSEDDSDNLIVIGPLLILNGSRGFSAIELFPDDTSGLPKANLVLNDIHSTSFSAVGTTILWVFLLVLLLSSAALVLRLLKNRKW